MRSRRIFLYALAIVLATTASYTVFLTKPFAQPPAGPGMGGPGGEGAGGGGQQDGRNYQWGQYEMPDELLMTYEEFLASEGQAPVPIPRVYLMDRNGNPKRYTRKMWYQLARVYRDRPPQIQQEQIGSPGGELWSKLYTEAAVKHNEMNALWDRWKAALNQFWFEIGYPRVGPRNLRFNWERKSVRHANGTVGWKRWEATLPDPFTITIPVVMHVNDDCRKSYARNFYEKMKKYSRRGPGRSPFEFVTYEGGMYRPHTFYLADETIQVWNYLWNLLQVRLRLYDTEKTMITQAPQPSGLTPSIFTQMVHPPTIYYTPRYRLLLSPEDNKFEGGRLNLNGKRGWYFEFDFQMSREDLKALDDARARLIVDGGPPETMRSIPSPMAAAAAGGGAGPGEAQPAEGGMGGPPAAETGEGAAARGPGAGEVGMGATGAGGSPAGSAAASAAPETVPPAY